MLVENPLPRLRGRIPPRGIFVAMTLMDSGRLW